MNLPRVKYRMPWDVALINAARFPLKVLLKLAVPILAIWGRYPQWVLTPDDPVSPFGCGSTPTASNEPMMKRLYAVPKIGRWLGDTVWLGWRNSGFWFAYRTKPEWLKRDGLRYEDLKWMAEVDGDVKTFWLQQPDGTWLWENQRKFGPFVLLTGYRIEPAYNGAQENRLRIARGEERAPRPGFHPNMDGRRIFSIRTKRTM